MFDNNPEEHYLKQSDPQKPTYYIIRYMSEKLELSDIYRFTLGHVRYALSKGWLPVVDMQNYPNLYLSPEKLGKENSWEYYFEQPLRIDLAQAYNGENVVLSDGNKAEVYPDYSLNLLDKKDDSLAEWRMLVKWDFIKIKSELMEEIKTIHDELFLPQDRVLGVLLREKDSSAEKIAVQPLSPSLEFSAYAAATKFAEWKCNKIFLMTKEPAVIEVFKNKFDDKCVLLDQLDVEYYNSDTDEDTGIFIEPENSEPEDEFFMRGKTYLTQIILLSLCNSLVAERCSDTTNAMLMTAKFANTYFFNLGNYGMINLN